VWQLVAASPWRCHTDKVEDTWP